MSELKSSKDNRDLISDYLSYSPLKSYDLIHDELLSGKFPELQNFSFVDNKTQIGIEVEVENLTAPELFANPIYGSIINQFWRQDIDESLRNNGAEFISQPIRGKAISAALTLINQHLHKHHPKHKFTHRTSVHVHMNCRHMERTHFLNLLLLYLVLEPIFYFYADQGEIKRSENNYCVPIDHTKFSLDLPQIIHEFTSPSVLRRVPFLTILGKWRKYNGLNLLPLKTLGTIEFRHMYGTSDPEVLTRWINMIFNLKRYAELVSFDELKNEIFELNTISSYSGFVKKIFGLEVQMAYGVLQAELEESSASVKAVLSFWNLKNKFKVTAAQVRVSNLGWYLNFKSIRKMSKKLDDAKVKYEFLMRREADNPNPSQAALDEIRHFELVVRDEQKQLKSLVTHTNYLKMGY